MSEYETFSFGTYEYDLRRSDGFTLVYDEEGDKILSLPGEDWEQDRLRAVITVVNRAYEAGVRTGKAAKAAEIRRALNVPEDQS